MPDWEERLRAGRGLVPELTLDRAQADRAVAIFNRLRLPDVEGQPTLGETGGEWFRDIVRAVLGSLLPSGARGISDVFLAVPKKNSKTTNGAGLMLAATMINRRPNARFGLFGPTQEVADIAFKAVVGMIAADEDLKTLFHVREHLKEVVYRPTKAVLKITTFDPAVATGGKFAGWLLDEMHLLGSVSYAARVIGQLRGARVAIPESFGVIITTQSDVKPAGAFREELDFARGVRDGTVQASGYLAVLYEFPVALQVAEDQPWLKQDNWPLVNPNWGRSVNAAALAKLYDEARQKSAEKLREWASQHLNVEIGVALHANRWPGAEHWKAAALPEVASLGDLLERCEVCTIGIDGGGLDDLLGLTVIGREKDTRRWISWSRAWIDQGELGKRKVIEAELKRFERHGDLRVVDIRSAEDVREVADIVEQIWLAGLLPEKYGIGLDPVGVAAIMDEIVARGVPAECLAPVPQGYRLSGEIKGAARKLLDGSLAHADQPLMDWCVGNAAQQLKGNADLITKEVAGKSKIDPLMALFNAHALMARNPEAAGGGRSYLEDGEVIAA
jgi:phage terminase large subunit-like protein